MIDGFRVLRDRRNRRLQPEHRLLDRQQHTILAHGQLEVSVGRLRHHRLITVGIRCPTPRR
jgi:catalase (peroxidase I)